MTPRYEVFDCDTHVYEPWGLWLNYVDEESKDRRPVGMTEDLNIDADEGPTKYSVDWVRPGNVMFSTDYPQSGCKNPYLQKQF